MSDSRILHELAGAASLCWEPKPTGVFNTEQAIRFVEEALAELRADEPVNQLSDDETCALAQALLDIGWSSTGDAQYTRLMHSGGKLRKILCAPKALAQRADEPVGYVPLSESEIRQAMHAPLDALLDHIYEHGTAAEGVMARATKLARAIESLVVARMRGEGE